jgi:3'-phosphoadenosine 5'-phosphosulfate sulfotransferase (PAPS reductase)/FAD synthetase
MPKHLLMICLFGVVFVAAVRSVITHLLGKLGYLKSGKVKIMVVDTLHLFPETMEFLKTLEKHYEYEQTIKCKHYFENLVVGASYRSLFISLFLSLPPGSKLQRQCYSSPPMALAPSNFMCLFR